MAKNKSATKRLLKIIGILVLLIIVGGAAAKALGWLDGSPDEIEVETEVAELRTITQIVSASGRIQPEEEVIIRPDVSGEIIELVVEEGDFVRDGELLLRIKPDIYQARIDELNAALLTQQSRMEQARASKLQAELEFQKNQQLFERDLISDLEFSQIKTNLDSENANFKAAEYQVESAKAQLRRAEEELQQTVIRAPRDGTISRLSVERGDRVLGNTQTAGTEMMRIARLEQMELSVEVNENDIVNVSLQDTASIEVDAYPNRSFEGIVTEIANSADITGEGSAEQVTNYSVKIRITTPHNLEQASAQMVSMQVPESPEEGFSPVFKPGMSGTVDIKTNTVYDVVSIPIQAVTVRDFAQDAPESDADSLAAEEETSEPIAASGGRSNEDFRRVVFINDNGVAKRVEVETGISDNSYIQVNSGVEAGDEVVTGSYRILSRELQHEDKIKTSNSDLLANQTGGN